MARPYKKRLNKRWYVDATIGKNVPVIGGTGLRMGTGSLTKRSLDSHIKSVVKNQVLEPKIYRSGFLASPANVKHDTLYSYNLFAPVAVGTDEENRIADNIGVKGISLNMELANAATGGSDVVKFRILVVKSKVGNAASGIISSHLGYTDIFWGTASGMLTAPVCYDNCSVLTDSIVSIKPTVANQKANITHKVKFKPPSSFKYGELNNQLGKFYNYYVVVIPWISRGTTGVTTVGDFTINHVMTFTDSK